MEEREEEEYIWSRETLPKVLKIVSTWLAQRELNSLLLVSPFLHHSLVSCSSLWQTIDLREMNDAGNRLVRALSLPRYQHVRQIDLEFAQDIEDRHLELLKQNCSDSLKELESLNLNGCQKVSDKGIQAISRVTDVGIEHLVKSCKQIVDLNLSGCKNITDKSLKLVAASYPELENLNLTRCVKLTDSGLQEILFKCSSLKRLNLYALSGFTYMYKSLSLLRYLKFLDLCGAQNLSDEGLFSVAKCKYLASLNLTWCVQLTDAGIKAIAHGCRSLEFLSLFGIVGVTDECLEFLSKYCSDTITTLDVNGCIGIKPRWIASVVSSFDVLQSAQLISWHSEVLEWYPQFVLIQHFLAVLQRKILDEPTQL